MLLGVAAMIVVAGCSKIKELETRVDSLDGRLTELEKKVAEMNIQIDAIQKLLSGKYFVKDVADLEDGSGYKLTLVDVNGKSTVKVVLNGQDGETPVVGVRQDSDGNWYWTVDGQWLLQGGQKVRADGEDGASPQVKVEDGKWYVSYDGKTWSYVGEAVTQAVCLIAGIDADSDPYNVVFTLTSGETFTVPKAAVKLQIVFDEAPFSAIPEGGSMSTEYEVIVPQGITYSLSSYEPQGWAVVFTPTEANKGIITMIVPEGTKSGKVQIIVTGSDGSNFVRVVEVGVKKTESYVVDSKAGQVVVRGASSLKLIGTADWVSVDGDTVTLAENTTYDARTATFTYTDSDGEIRVVVIVQAQKDAIVLSASSVEAKPEGEAIAFVLSANVDVTAATDADWLTVAPATKGLVEKPFVITAKLNDTGADRSATVTFSSGQLQQTVEVTQALLPIVTGPTGVFSLVQDASQLSAGDRLLIVSQDGKYAMGGSQGNYRDRVSVTVSDGSITDPSDDVQIVTLEGSEDAWNLSVGDGQYLAAASSRNYLQTVSSVSDYAKWTISISGAEATIQAANGGSTILCYNSSSPRFSCYSSTNNQIKLVSVYKEESTYVPYLDPIREQSALGCYIGTTSRTYTRGTDQLVRLSGAFVIACPGEAEQLSISGFGDEPALGDAVSVTVNWRKGIEKIISSTYRMHVAKLEDDRVWLGDGKGNGFIVRK